MRVYPDNIPDPVVGMISSICSFKKGTDLGEAEKLYMDVTKWINQLHFDNVVPVIINSYNRRTFLFEDEGVDYLVVDMNLLKTLEVCSRVYFSDSINIMLVMVIEFLHCERAYADNAMDDAVLHFLNYLEGIDLLSENPWNLEVEYEWGTWIRDFCILHELGHYCYKYRRNESAYSDLYEVVEYYEKHLEFMDSLFNRFKKEGFIDRFQDVIADALQNDEEILSINGIDNKELTPYLSEEDIIHYIQYIKINSFHSYVTKSRYVEECFSDLFAAQNLFQQTDIENHKEILWCICFITETVYMMRSIDKNERAPQELFKIGVDRINIFSASFRILYDDFSIEGAVNQFFQNDYNYDYCKKFIDALNNRGLIDLFKCVLVPSEWKQYREIIDQIENTDLEKEVENSKRK